MQYSAFAPIYIDPNEQSPGSAALNSSYERQDEKGSLFRVEVTSQLSADGRTSITTVRSLGGLNLALNAVGLGSAKTLPEGFTLQNNPSLAAVGLEGDLFEVAATGWLRQGSKIHPEPERFAVSGESYYVLASQNSGQNEVSFIATGSGC